MTAAPERPREDIVEWLRLVEVQTHCYTCGKQLGDIRYVCPICNELCCSEACRTRHIETMDAI